MATRSKAGRAVTTSASERGQEAPIRRRPAHFEYETLWGMARCPRCRRGFEYEGLLGPVVVPPSGEFESIDGQPLNAGAVSLAWPPQGWEWVTPAPGSPSSMAIFEWFRFIGQSLQRLEVIGQNGGTPNDILADASLPAVRNSFRLIRHFELLQPTLNVPQEPNPGACRSPHAAILQLDIARAWIATRLTEISHGHDFRSVVWHGTRYTFSENQAACVKLLWEAWENGGHEIGGKTLLEAADTDGDRLDVVFRNHPAWRRMIAKGETKGSYRLVIPDGPAG